MLSQMYPGNIFTTCEPLPHSAYPDVHVLAVLPAPPPKPKPESAPLFELFPPKVKLPSSNGQPIHAPPRPSESFPLVSGCESSTVN